VSERWRPWQRPARMRPCSTVPGQDTAQSASCCSLRQVRLAALWQRSKWLVMFKQSYVRAAFELELIFNRPRRPSSRTWEQLWV